MARVELPESKLRARRRRRRLLRWLVGAGVLLLVCGGALALAWAPFVRIERVVIVGGETVPRETLEEMVYRELQGTYWSILPKSNIFLYPNRDLAAHVLERYPILQSADIAAQDFQTLTVTLLERELRALWCGETVLGPCFLMDQDGVVYAPAAQGAEAYVRYLGAVDSGVPRQYLEPDVFRSLAALVDALKEKEQLDIVQVVAERGGDVRVEFTNGFMLYFTLEDDGGDIFERYTLGRSAEPFVTHALADFEYLDLRFGDKLYYKLKEQ
jgi:hypothetical protein